MFSQGGAAQKSAVAIRAPMTAHAASEPVVFQVALRMVFFLAFRFRAGIGCRPNPAAAAPASLLRRSWSWCTRLWRCRLGCGCFCIRQVQILRNVRGNLVTHGKVLFFDARRACRETYQFIQECKRVIGFGKCSVDKRIQVGDRIEARALTCLFGSRIVRVVQQIIKCEHGAPTQHAGEVS
jgi:hypothetical protein